jgi:excinuclease ABC subunit A
MTVRGARANNLRGVDVRFPSGVLLGVCGVSGSGKSSWVMDTLGGRSFLKNTRHRCFRAVDQVNMTQLKPRRSAALLIDQRKRCDQSADYLGIQADLIRLYAAGEDACALGISEEALSRRCTACGGSGQLRIDMGFLPTFARFATCARNGLFTEAWHVRVNGKALLMCSGLTVDEVYKLFKEEASIVKILAEVRAVGLGYLVLRQPDTRYRAARHSV